MHHLLRKTHRLCALALAAVLTLQLSGCSWYFMPGPVIITDAFPPESTTKEEPSGEITTEGETSSESTETADSADAGSTSVPAPPSSSSEEPSSETASLPTEPASSSEDPSTSSSAAGTETAESSSAEQPSSPETSFSVDYYRTPDFLHKVASDSLLVDAHNVISACLAYKTSVKVNCTKKQAGLVLYLADSFCPLLKAFTNISESSWSDGTISWDFYVDKVEFSIIRAEFEQQVAAYIEPILNTDYSETERALLLYHAYTAPASYNYEIISGVFNTYTEAEQHRIHSAFAGIMDHKGVCHDLAGGMTFLFIQAGFNACRVSVITKDDEHSWTLIELDGRDTFCDATWDVGGSFSYFGNSARDWTAAIGGSFKLSDMNIYDLNAPANFTIVNPGFKKMHNFSLSNTGTLMNLSIDTAASPHMLRITNTVTGRSIVMECP